MTLHRSATVTVAACATALLIGAGWWLWGPESEASASALLHAGADARAAPRPPLTNRKADGLVNAMAKARQDANTDALLVRGLRDTLEALLLAAGDSPDPETLKLRLAGHIGDHFDAALATRALAIAERYVDYRVALGQLEFPQDLTDAAVLRESIRARDALRRRFFDDTEYSALFDDQETLERYTLARMEIEQSTALSQVERTTALERAEGAFGETQRAERAYSQVQVEVAAQTAQFDQDNTDARSRYTARSAQFGDDAATRLATLDAQERDWNQRLAVYGQARDTQPGDASLTRLRAQIFSAEEALRVDAALELQQLDRASAGRAPQ